MKARDWLMTAICLLGLLILMAMLDRPVAKDCTAVIKDQYGYKHEVIGKISFVCPIKDGCQ